MKKLALIGKNISHSKSPEIYKKIYYIPHTYDLLDYQNENLIPSLIELSTNYFGINITSPYKKHFLNQVVKSKAVSLCDSLNCLCFSNGKVFAENTDFLAVKKILSERFHDRLKEPVIILGDGVMSFVVSKALEELNCSFKILSRKTVDHFDHLNLTKFKKDPSRKNLVINTCSRDFVFKGILDINSFFWDLNYAFSPHLNHHIFHSGNYIDGEELLNLQAQYAVEFWSTKESI